MRLDRIGTEHLLLALLKDSDSVAARILLTLNVNLQKLYQDILDVEGIDPRYIKKRWHPMAESEEMACWNSTNRFDIAGRTGETGSGNRKRRRDRAPDAGVESKDEE